MKSLTAQHWQIRQDGANFAVYKLSRKSSNLNSITDKLHYMKIRVLLILGLAVFLGSCGAYKAAQTTDDVYYSSGGLKEGYVSNDENTKNNDEYYNFNESADDRMLRMKVKNPNRWSTFDDPYYSSWSYNSWMTNPFYSPYYSPYYSGSSFWMTTSIGWGNMFWGSTWYNPYCYTPAYRPIVITSKPVYVNPLANGPRGSGFSGYGMTGTNYNSTTWKSSGINSTTTRNSTAAPVRVFDANGFSGSSSNSTRSSYNSGYRSGSSSTNQRTITRKDHLLL
jgi:hypothetical protein